jgi:virginiamycin B lyase
MLRSLSLCLFLLALAWPLAASEQHRKPLDIKEWPLPWPKSGPADPQSVSPAAVWFVARTGNFLGVLNPQTGRFSRIDLIDEPAPQGLIVGANSMLWFTSKVHGYIGRYDLRSKSLWRAQMPNAAAGDPSSLVFEAGERNIWFTVTEGNIIGRLRIVNGVVDLTGVATPHALPSGVAMAPNAGNPWVALYGTNKIATVDARTFALTEHPLPRAGARPRRIAFTSDGRLWYSDFAEGYLGAFTPGTKAVKEWQMPGGKKSQPYALTVDSEDHVWIVETGSKPAKLVGFDPKSEQFFGTTAVGGTISDMSFDRAGNQLWFGTDNTIAVAKLPDGS